MRRVVQFVLPLPKGNLPKGNLNLNQGVLREAKAKGHQLPADQQREGREKKHLDLAREGREKEHLDLARVVPANLANAVARDHRSGAPTVLDKVPEW